MKGFKEEKQVCLEKIITTRSISHHKVFSGYLISDTLLLQFPIEMSMPWILTDHILETKEPSMME